MVQEWGVRTLIPEEQLGYGYSGKSRRCDVDSLPSGLSNGEIIASSEVYKSKASAKNGIESVRKNAPGATVVDETGE